MQLQVTPNIQFTRLLKADGRLREFNFRKLGGSSELMFSVDVVDDRGNRVMFHLHRGSGEWKIIENELPSWVIENETALHRCIEEQ